MIYYLQQKGNQWAPIKIGYTFNHIEQRLTHAQGGYPFGELWVLARHDGDREDEARLHVEWHHLRMRGEWFASDPRLLEHVRLAPRRYGSTVTTEVRRAIDLIGLLSSNV